MPQLAPVNWLFLFILFWFVVALTSTLVWWSFKLDYQLPSSASPLTGPSASNSWSW